MHRPKKLSDQVVVITGASSGIGLATARLAASRGATVVLTARNEDALKRAVAEIHASGGKASYVAADVSRYEDVERLATEVERRHGRIDAWFNNAAVGLYGRCTEVSLEDMRRLFDIDFWGVVHGSRVAVARMRERGGVLINMGSMVSKQVIPLLGTYAAAKHALQAFTDALRVELEEAGAPIAVVTVRPGSIDTPFFEHAMNYMETEPKPPPPVYAPEIVARAAVECMERPVRDVTVGGAAKAQITLGQVAPRLMDRILEKSFFSLQKSDRPAAPNRVSALHSSSTSRAVTRGGYPGHVAQHSPYTTAALHPGWVALGTALGSALLGLFVFARFARPL